MIKLITAIAFVSLALSFGNVANAAVPVVTTVGATNFMPGSVVLDATVNPKKLATSYYFRYGTTTNYGSSSTTNVLGASNVVFAVSNSLSGLSPGTTYHFTITASNSSGIVAGTDMSFQARGLTNLVTNTQDDGSAGCLRSAVANAFAGDVVRFDPSLSGQTITLSSARITLNSNVFIDGSALASPIQLTTPFGLSKDMIFSVNSNTIVVLDSVNIFGGESGSVGGIFNLGTLTVTNCGLSNNYGGSIDNESVLTVNNSTFSGSFGGNGGGIINNGALTVNNSTFHDNQGYRGGGISHSAGTATVNNCVFWNNGQSSEGLGGAVFSSGDAMTMNNCTLWTNFAWEGGGVFNGTLLTMNNCTVVANRASQSIGGIFTQGTLNLTNCIITGNGNTDFLNVGVLNASSNNFLSGDPMLAPLGNYGGPTQTAPPLPGSPVIDAGTDSVTNLYATDQSGSPRAFGLHVDLGAVESTNAPAPPLVMTQPAFSVVPGTATINATITPNGAVTTYYFQYGTTTNYGSTTATNILSAGGVAVSANLTNLPSGVTCHFRAVAANNRGTTLGGDLSFYTSQIVTVTNAGDNGPGSLRATLANVAAGSIVNFDASLSGQTILLTGGQIVLSNNVIIDASALPGGIQINGNSNSAVFSVTGGTTVLLNSMNIAGGKNGFGGGVYSQGNLTVSNCSFSGNVASQAGGGIYNDNGGNLTVINSLFSSNVANSAANNGPGNGGGIYNYYDSTLIVSNSVFSGNSAINQTNGSGGGGIYCLGPLTMNNSTLSSNSAVYGGGLCQITGSATVGSSTFFGNRATNGGGVFNGDETVILNNCTLAGNFAILGGGILNQTTLVLNNTTVSANSAAIGGGIYNEDNDTLNDDAALVLTNSIVAGNTNGSGTDFTAPVYLVLSSNNFINGNPMLAPLGSNGGLTQTMMPLLGSPVIDAGDDSAASFLATDQRGFSRQSASHVDLGAVELQQAAIVSVSVSNIANTSATLNGSITPGDLPANWYFQYGTDAHYGGASPTNALSSGFAPVAVSFPLTGLNPATIYHFQIFAADSVSLKSSGDFVFDTGGGVVSSNAAVLAGLTQLGNGAVQFSFTNLPGANFSVLASTNAGSPVNTWSNLGPVLENPAGSGQYQFSDPQTSNLPGRFYRVVSP